MFSLPSPTILFSLSFFPMFKILHIKYSLVEKDRTVPFLLKRKKSHKTKMAGGWILKAQYVRHIFGRKLTKLLHVAHRSTSPILLTALPFQMSHLFGCPTTPSCPTVPAVPPLQLSHRFSCPTTSAVPPTLVVPLLQLFPPLQLP
jgi:hypothetical protein